MLPTILALTLVLESSSAASVTSWNSGLDQQWQRYLDSPPPQVTNLSTALEARADVVVSSIDTPVFLSGDIDVVCSGGGDLNGYYMGVLMVLSRLQSRGSLRQVRHAGASAGGWMSFENKLKGEARTLMAYLSYGLLEEHYPVHYATTASAVLLQDHHWRMMAIWQANKWNASLDTLDGNVYLALTCLNPMSTLILVDEYTSPEQAASAFVATGAILEHYDGMICSDGSGKSGPRMTPLFADGPAGTSLRMQLVVDLMHVTNAVDTFQMGFGKFTTAQYAALVRRGQDEAAELLRTGKPPRRDARAITLCPAGARVVDHVCAPWSS